MPAIVEPPIKTDEAFDRIQNDPSEAARIFRQLGEKKDKELLETFKKKKRTLVPAASGGDWFG